MPAIFIGGVESISGTLLFSDHLLTRYKTNPAHYYNHWTLHRQNGLKWGCYG